MVKILSLALLALITLGGCIAVPVGEPVVYGPSVVVDPFPHVWIGPGYYGGRRYDRHPHSSHPSNRGGGRGGRR